jgi:lipoprotein-anchoring transpeptidase ErfK/SrfK
MPRALTILLLTLSMSALAAPGASAQTPAPQPAPPPAPVPAPEPRIRAGVSVSNVDVGNLTVAEAQARLEQTLGPVFAQDIAVVAGAKRFVLKPTQLKFAFRADKTALRALAAGAAAPPAPDGSLPPASALPLVSYRDARIWRFARKVEKAVHVAPRDARARIRLTRVTKRPGRKGAALAVRPLTRAIEAVLTDPLVPREVQAPMKSVAPKVRMKDIRRQYRTVITIDRSSFRLRLFKRFRVVKRYGVAVGQAAYPTPTGLFAIQSKQVNPTWTAPNSPWAGEMAGQQVAGGAADNPLKARWMGVSGAVGIHGTGQPWTIGSQASHGCIRMTVPDVIDLFGRVSIGTPVLIG